MKTKSLDSEKVEESKSTGILDLSDDLLIQIFLRFRLRDLFRFKAVSKIWHSVITGPEFGHIRNLNCTPEIGFFLQSTDYRGCNWLKYVPLSGENPRNPPFKRLNFPDDPCGAKVLHSCNNLFLCCSSDQLSSGDRVHYVFNPTTQKIATIPKLETEARGVRVLKKQLKGINLVFDPMNSPDYKVVCVQQLGIGSDSSHQIEVYSSEIGGWRVCSKPFINSQKHEFKHGVYCNGSIHWISYRMAAADPLYFNVKSCVLKTMPRPPLLYYGWSGNDVYFGESGGHLYHINNYNVHFRDHRRNRINIFEMRRDYSEWFVKYHVDLTPIASAYPKMILKPSWEKKYSFTILSFDCGKQGDDDASFILQIPGKTLVRFYPVSQICEKLYEFKSDQSLSTHRGLQPVVFEYFESYSSV